jgi:hypothetical protein
LSLPINRDEAKNLIGEKKTVQQGEIQLVLFSFYYYQRKFPLAVATGRAISDPQTSASCSSTPL